MINGVIINIYNQKQFAFTFAGSNFNLQVVYKKPRPDLKTLNVNTTLTGFVHYPLFVLCSVFGMGISSDLIINTK